MADTTDAAHAWRHGIDGSGFKRSRRTGSNQRAAKMHSSRDARGMCDGEERSCTRKGTCHPHAVEAGFMSDEEQR
jgi:hypothetical protein